LTGNGLCSKLCSGSCEVKCLVVILYRVCPLGSYCYTTVRLDSFSLVQETYIVSSRAGLRRYHNRSVICFDLEISWQLQQRQQMLTPRNLRSGRRLQYRCFTVAVRSISRSGTYPIDLCYLVCTFPPEYCEFGNSISKCKEWLQAQRPDLYEKYYSDGAQTTSEHYRAHTHAWVPSVLKRLSKPSLEQ
jgi:hypothetical protein